MHGAPPIVRETSGRRISWRTDPWRRWSLIGLLPVPAVSESERDILLYLGEDLALRLEWDELRPLHRALGLLLESSTTADPGLEPLHGPIEPLDGWSFQPPPPSKPEPARAGQPWLGEEDDELRQLHSEGESLRALAEHLGRTPGAVRSRLGKLGVEFGPARPRPAPARSAPRASASAPIEPAPTRP